ncbi:hypothetical protein [Halomicrobium katesii]|uniref:hypothetical protein n=1 Tax=Halomicrobium katesii TaxID=437163 RepID=UPI0003731BC1|nr:hypothetical protein [Halomicrobium katesii]
MPEYIDAGVAELRDSESDDEVTLLVGVSGDRDEFATRVEECAGTVTAQIGQATLRVTAPESAVDALCELDGLKSIEIERDDVRTLSEGNGHSRQRLTRS